MTRLDDDVPVEHYSLLIVSPISIWRDGEEHESLDLWVRDVAAQANVVGRLCIVGPRASERYGSSRRLPSGVRVVMHDEVATSGRAEAVVRDYDVVQIGSGAPRWRSGMDLRFARAARGERRRLITVVSSNRAKTTLLNGESKPWPKRMKSRLVARSIAATTRRLIGMADGAILVGHGLDSLLPERPPPVYYETATWIQPDEVITLEAMAARLERMRAAQRLRICVATRLERMKGVHVAIETLRLLRMRMGASSPTLTVLGVGPELAALQSSVELHGLCDVVGFGGTHPYPQPFLRELAQFDLLVLTNLNDEQPRVVFDAASQGVVAVCPDSPPYRALSIDPRTMYVRGDARSLADVVERLYARETLARLSADARSYALAHTIDAMHARRAAWVSCIRRTRATPGGEIGRANLGALSSR